MRCHKDPTQKTTQAQQTPRNPDSRHKRGGTTPDQGRYTR